MEVIKRKILLEKSIDRSYNSKTWGSLTATTFYINIFLTQNIDDMGLFVDMDFIEKDKINSTVDYSILTDKLTKLNIQFPFMTGKPNPEFTKNNTDKNLWNVLRYPDYKVSNYYNYTNLVITATTDSRIEDVRSYNILNPFRVGLELNKETYLNYENTSVNGIDMMVSNTEPKVYVFDTPNDYKMGTNNQIHGLQFKEFSADTKAIVRYIGEGFNQTNTSLSALGKEEYLFGIISPPEVENDVFIDRGKTSVMDKHLKLSEIRTLKGLENYGNGFYNINKQ